MANNVLWQRPQFQLSTGLPVANGTLVTSVSGSSTPKATYPTETDLQNLTNANATSLTLNSTGTPSVDLWLNGSYRFSVYDSSSNLIYQSDDINVPDTLRDANGTPLCTLSSVANSVNYVRVTDSATSTAPILTFTGSDSNVSGTISCKGSGTLSLPQALTVGGGLTATGGISIGAGTSPITFPAPSLTVSGNAGNSASVILGENTTNGTNTMKIQAPSTFSNLSWLLPSVATSGLLQNISGTLGALNGYIIKQIVTGSNGLIGITASVLYGGVAGSTTQINISSVASNFTSITPTSTSSLILAIGCGYWANAFAGANAMQFILSAAANFSTVSSPCYNFGSAKFLADVSGNSFRMMPFVGWARPAVTSLLQINGYMLQLGASSSFSGLFPASLPIVFLDLVPV